ncbi:MAG: antibiotic biosynthesis monooxygenase [Solobacterium sp.]|nr:antibiotic biosynthesis monooxygenase [Solobacterium sp.]
MIVLNVTYKCKKDLRDEYLERIMAEGIDKASREEAGNLKYDYYYAAADDDELFLFEKWKDAEAFEEHKKQPHFQKLQELKGEYLEDTIIDRYEI